MAFVRSDFGIEYNPRPQDDSSGLGWLIAVVAVVAFGSLTWTLVARYRAARQDEALVSELVENSAEESEVETTAVVTNVPTAPIIVPSTEVIRRPQNVRNLLLRLEAAEKQQDLEVAASTIEQLRSLPGSPVADLDDALARRLGNINVRRMFDLKNPKWVRTIKVKRGDSASRLAYESGTTLAAVQRLNGGDLDKLRIGAKFYVLDHPKFTLVIHRRMRTADLSLDRRFFKRYDLTDEVKAREGAYEMPAQPRTFWNSFGRVFKAADRAELECFLAAGSSILVAEM